MDVLTRWFTRISFCSGYDGIGLALKGIIPTLRTICYVEREAFAIANLAAKIKASYLDDAPVWSDLKTFDPTPWIGRVDLLDGGFPCQPFSNAGKKASVDDERHLYPIISRCIGIIRPRRVFLENVGAISSSKTGGWETVLHYVLNDLERMGYLATADFFRASEVGAPHERERCFILGKLADTKHQPRGAEQRTEPGRRHRATTAQIDVLGGTGADQQLANASSGGQRTDGSPSGSSGHVDISSAPVADASGLEGSVEQAGRETGPEPSRSGQGSTVANPNSEHDDGRRPESGEVRRTEQAAVLADAECSHREAGPEPTGREEGTDTDRSIEGTAVGDTERVGRGSEQQSGGTGIGRAKPEGATELADSTEQRSQGLRPDRREGPDASVGEVLSRSGSLIGGVWPACLGQEAHSWEPPRTVSNTKSGGSRRRRVWTGGRKPRAGGSGTEGGEGSDATTVLRESESEMGRDVDGSAGGMGNAELRTSADSINDELRLLGNGVVPAQVAFAFVTLEFELDELL